MLKQPANIKTPIKRDIYYIVIGLLFYQINTEMQNSFFDQKNINISSGYEIII